MNPSGIVFGSGASLNVPGSFIAGTAERVLFANGVSFGVDGTTPNPLLTVSAPIGLQMGQNPGSITVQNTGHRLIEGNVPLQLGTTPNGLQVSNGNTLGLLGGDITLDGGILNAPSGYLELGSTKAGTVNLDTTPSGWKFDYTNLQQFNDIRFLHQALANASGTPAGSMHLQGRNISINEGSVALLTNQANQASGRMTINASESLTMLGVGPYGFAQNLLITNAITGDGGNLEITAPILLSQDGGRISTYTYGSGRAGNISVVADSIQFSGFSPLKPATTRTGIMSDTMGSGQAGDIQVTTQQLKMQDGGSITSASFSTGATGNVMVNAADSIELSGETPISFQSSLLGTVSFNRGNGGSVTVNTSRLAVQRGAGVSASTLGQGNAGTLQINASEQISVSGISPASGKPGAISASASVLPLSFQQAFGLSALPTGNSGSLIINAPRLEVSGGGLVRVSHQGVGSAGNLYITADTVSLDRGGSISASTLAGEGGNISLQSTALILRHGSNLTAAAGGTGQGGNINLTVSVIAGVENSDIIASAFQGNGGNIQITTQGIFGLAFRPQLTPENDITASSQFGINGTVTIRTPGIDPGSSLAELPTDLNGSSQQVAGRCSASSSDNSFTATGRGGLPLNPSEGITADTTWSDTRDLSTFMYQAPVAEAGKSNRQSINTIVEISSWRINADGQVELMAT